jgi:uncharacterized protein (TIGR02118 family)
LEEFPAMICVSALYPAAGESRFDHTYYLDKHIPLLHRLLTPHGLQKVEVDEGLGGFAPGSAPNYKIICRMYFDTIENFQAGVNTVGGEIFADVPNYTDIPVEIQVSKIVY